MSRRLQLYAIQQRCASHYWALWIQELTSTSGLRPGRRARGGRLAMYWQPTYARRAGLCLVASRTTRARRPGRSPGESKSSWILMAHPIAKSVNHL